MHEVNNYKTLFLAGSDSDENSDGTSQRSTLSSRHHFQQQHLQLQVSQSSVGIRPCPYNFLVQLGNCFIIYIY